MVKWLVATSLLLVPVQDDPTAKALHDGMRERIDRAASLRAEFAVVLVRKGQEFGSCRGVLKLKDGDRWSLELALVRRDLGEEERHAVAYHSDGRRTRLMEGLPELRDELLKPKEFALLLRRSCVDTVLPLLHFADPRLLERDGVDRPSEPGAFRSGGREKVAGRDAEVLEYPLKVSSKLGTWKDGALKGWVDREKKLPVQRVLRLDELVLMETISLELDADLPDGDFSFQSRHRLARAQATQLAESVRLFGRHVGRPPDSLEELARKPADLDPDIFWPRGGFLPGPLARDPWERPFGLIVRAGRRSIVCLGADGREGGKGEDEDVVVELSPPTGGAIGAPTERLAKFFDARIELQLLMAAVKAYQETYGELPREEKELRAREPWMTVWPDGGWIPAGKDLRDPWGDPYRFVCAEHHVRAHVEDAKAVLQPEELTEEERRRLEETGQPRVRAADRDAVAVLLDRLGDDDYDVREKAQTELRGWGPVILSMLEQRLKRETDREIVYRLHALRKSLPKHQPGWISELGRLRWFVFGENLRPQNIRRNEFLASVSLRRLCDEQADYRSKDRDGNGIHDFWTGDVAGLVRGKALAALDAAPLEPAEDAAKQARRNGYWYRVLRKDNSTAPPEEYQLDTGGQGGPKTFNRNRFGYVSYPMEYPVTGVRTFIINEGRMVFWKDNQGEPVEAWPDEATLKREWIPVN